MHYSDDRRDNLEVGQHEHCSKSNDSTSKMFFAITHSQRKPLWQLLDLICSHFYQKFNKTKKRKDISVVAVLVSSETDISIADHRLKKEVWYLQDVETENWWWQTASVALDVQMCPPWDQLTTSLWQAERSHIQTARKPARKMAHKCISIYHALNLDCHWLFDVADMSHLKKKVNLN